MSSRLFNVRLDEERLRRAKVLRENGITLSDVVRTAIDQRYEEFLSSCGPRDVSAILAKLDAEYPIAEDDLPPSRYDVHDRLQAADAIRKRLKHERVRARGK